MSKIPVLISINSNAHRDEDTDEPMALLTSGTMHFEGEKLLLNYEENIDESLPPQPVEIIVEGQTVSMVRGGAFETIMVFSKGWRYEGQYQTPVGSMELAIYCTRLHHNMTASGGTIEVNYQLDLNSRFSAMHELELNVIVQHD